ncbi:hypothetical protein BKP45_00950 [Anaerobacillus alkalidiazotrophicus]|uniref:Calcineurin-like phosphoesterase domain-containing protein n=1 Tax=Anaerobacillus alkalidiazotrophicus TaxID=472963 RepID=A0A1S2M9G9_9BACI|nr:DNA repair exonuclease [Anaerobacillus alkalidiazotrophicus]OIJ21378.1 hypothetical protein BKP45_00950 [Anaerobacillus alkalidiazotrophicus]
MKNIRFIHAADLHLDSPFQGLKNLPEVLVDRVKESTFEALQRIVLHAIEYQVDFVIFAGDLFDGENRSYKAQSRLKKAFEELDYYGIACYIIHGNHDHLKGNWISLTWPKNVFFFKGQVECFDYKKEEITVHIYGFSYPEKSVTENMTSYYQKVGNANFHIGILHGTAEGQEGHDSYAPFSVKQLLEKNFDYWALGHIHKKQILHQKPYIVYSGNTQGRHKKELGEKGVYLVELSDTNTTTLTFLPTSQIYWEEFVVSIDGIEEVDILKNRCEVILEEANRFQKGLFAILRFTGVGPLHDYLIEEVDDLIEILNIGQEEKSSFTYVIDKKVETIGQWDREQLKREQHLVKDIVTVVDRLFDREEPMREILDELYSNPKVKRYVETLTVEEQKQLLQEAENYLLAILLKEKDE